MVSICATWCNIEWLFVLTQSTFVFECFVWFLQYMISLSGIYRLPFTMGTMCVSCDVVSEVWCTIATHTSLERPCHGSCGQSLTCHGGVPGLILLDQSMWVLWWTKRHWECVVFSINVSAPFICSHCYLILLRGAQAGEEHSNTAVLFRIWWNTAEKHFHIRFCC